jgi:hypothetical protein
VSWDSKITTVNAILGGVGENYVKEMKEDGIYEEFIDIVQVSVSLLPFFPPTANTRLIMVLTERIRNGVHVFER